MKGRILPGIALALSWVVLLLYASVPVFFCIVIAVLFLAADEYIKMVRHKGGAPPFFARLPLAVILLLPVVSAAFSPGLATVGASSFVGFLLFSCWHIKQFSEVDAESRYFLYVKDISGLFYVGVLAAHICLLRMLPEGAAWILVATAITAGSDSGAYFSGRYFGRHKLCPAVSPKKTIEGAVGGVCSAAVAALVFGCWLLDRPQFFLLLAIAVFLSLLGVIGDLTESVIKRGVGVKDSGSCLGGHGGILDRIDSLLFAIPALYYILLFFNSVSGSV